MYSRMISALAVSMALAMTLLNMPTAAQASTLYVARSASTGSGTSGEVWAYDSATGNPLAGYTPVGFTSYMAGIAVSPDGSTLYTYINGSGTIKTYNAHTGGLVNASFVTGLSYALNGITVDPATGNIYGANSNGNGGVTQITPAGVVNETWGTPPTGAVWPVGETVYNGKVYIATASSGANVVVSYPSATGGSPTEVVSGFRGDWPSFDSAGNLYTFKSNAPAYWQKWTGPFPSTTHANFGDLQFRGYSQQSQYDGTDGMLYVTGQLTDAAITSGIWKIDPTAATPTFTQVVDFTGATYYYPICFALSTIPEPSTFALLGMGLLGLLAYAWRKRK